MKLKLISAISAVLLLVTLISCNSDKNQRQQSESDSSEETIFPKGALGPATNFTGNAYNFGLVANDSIYNTLVGIACEVCCRTEFPLWENRFLRKIRRGLLTLISVTITAYQYDE